VAFTKAQTIAFPASAALLQPLLDLPIEQAVLASGIMQGVANHVDTVVNEIEIGMGDRPSRPIPKENINRAIEKDAALEYVLGGYSTYAQRPYANTQAVAEALSKAGLDENKTQNLLKHLETTAKGKLENLMGRYR
jgi:hypothetical protein